ncbi:MAG: hypothetical protein WCH32_11600 [Pseudomonadota bacterium]
MNRVSQTLSRFAPGGLLLGLLVAVAANGAPSAAPTADEIVAHNLEARGGAAKMRALTVLRRSGRLVIPGFNIELAVTEWQDRAGDFRQDVTLQGLTAIQSYDGHEAWQVQPFEGRKDPSLMSGDEARAMSLSADIEFPFVDAAAKGHKLEYLGLEDIDGTPAHALRVRLKGGDDATYWVDPDTWMVIRVLEKHTIRGAEQVQETDLGEYQQVAGVWVPMSEEQGPKDSDASQRQKIVFDHVEANVAVPAGHFAFPDTQPKAAAGVRP